MFLDYYSHYMIYFLLKYLRFLNYFTKNKFYRVIKMQLFKINILYLLVIIALTSCAIQENPPPEPVKAETNQPIQKIDSEPEVKINPLIVEEYARIHQISDLEKAEFYLKNPTYAKENPYKPTDKDIEFYEREFLERLYPEFKEYANKVGFMKARSMYMNNPPAGPGSRRIGTTRYDNLFNRLFTGGGDAAGTLIFENDPAGASYQEGMRLYKLGQIDEAIVEMEKAVKIKPDAPGILYNLGVMYTQKEDYSKAVEVLQKSVESIEATGFTGLNLAVYSDSYMGALTNLGLVYMRIGMYSEAVKVLNKATRFKPEDIDANCDLVNAYYMMGDMEKATEQMRKCLKLDPDSPELNNFAGLMYYRRGLYEAALEAFQKAVKLFPEEKQYSYNLGLVLDKLGRQDEASQAFQKAEGFKDGDETMSLYIEKARSNKIKQLYNDAHDAMENRSWAKAIELFNQVLELDPNMLEAHFNLGFAYRSIGNKEKQIHHYKEALKIKQDEPNIHYSLGLAYSDSFIYSDAITEFRKVIELDPSFKDAHFQLGTALYKTGKYADAAIAFEKSIELDPEWYEAHSNLGSCYMKLDNTKAAIKYFKDAVLLKPNSAEAQYNLGAAYMNSGNYDEARVLFQKALELNPGHRQTRIMMKELEIYLGN